MDTEVEEKGPSDAPVWYNSREAIAWANGWNACMREMTQTEEKMPARLQAWLDHIGWPPKDWPRPSANDGTEAQIRERIAALICCQHCGDIRIHGHDCLSANDDSMLKKETP